MKADRRDFLELEELRRENDLPSILSTEEIIGHAPDKVLNESIKPDCWGFSRRAKERILIRNVEGHNSAPIGTYVRDMRAGLQHGVIHSLGKTE